ncbi:MAG: prepilin-type N-terminal cleavage/methylation domain-containing protein [Candidatus Sacchiramonaceae bacterium]|nr:prepilin-type N-terminal cleavage/methylation domain-containing protein [Candidatus Saccharimonadaceae bacterium]
MKQFFNRNNSPSQGFTIIEVVLILAIAGLIFLMVFIALPAFSAATVDTLPTIRSSPTSGGLYVYV